MLRYFDVKDMFPGRFFNDRRNPSTIRLFKDRISLVVLIF